MKRFVKKKVMKYCFSLFFIHFIFNLQFLQFLQYEYTEEDLVVFQKMDLFRTIQSYYSFLFESTTSFHYLSLSLQYLQLITNQVWFSLLLLIVQLLKKISIIHHTPFCSLDSYSSIHSVKLHSLSISHSYCISSITSLLFSILQSLSKGMISFSLSSQSISIIITTLCMILPYSDHCITEWIEV